MTLHGKKKKEKECLHSERGGSHAVVIVSAGNVRDMQAPAGYARPGQGWGRVGCHPTPPHQHCSTTDCPSAPFWGGGWLAAPASKQSKGPKNVPQRVRDGRGGSSSEIRADL